MFTPKLNEKFSLTTQQIGTQTLSTELNWVDKRIISNDQCTRSYGPSIVLPSTLCTLGWDNNSQSTCNGDSGGPLLLDEVREMKIVGGFFLCFK